MIFTRCEIFFWFLKTIFKMRQLFLVQGLYRSRRPAACWIWPKIRLSTPAFGHCIGQSIFLETIVSRAPLWEKNVVTKCIWEALGTVLPSWKFTKNIHISKALTSPAGRNLLNFGQPRDASIYLTEVRPFVPDLQPYVVFCVIWPLPVSLRALQASFFLDN